MDMQYVLKTDKVVFISISTFFNLRILIYFQKFITDLAKKIDIT